MEKEIEKISQNGVKTLKQSSNSQNGDEPSKACESAMKAFTMTNKRLYPKLYKGNAKIGKVRG